MKSVSSFELRDNLSSYLDLVEKKGKSYKVVRYKKPIAKIVPYYEEAESGLEVAKKYFGYFKDDFGGLSGADYVDKVRRSKEVKDDLDSLYERDLGDLK